MDNKKNEIDQLRIQLQYLQEKLERFNNLKVLIKRFLRILILDNWNKINKRAYKHLHNYDVNYKSKKFIPYQLNYKNTPDLKKPIILHLISNFKTGGASRIIVDIAESLSNDYRHIVITRYNPVPQNYVGIEVIELCNLPSNRLISNLLSKFDPILVHTHWSTTWSESDSIWQWYYAFYKKIEQLKLPLIQNVNIPVVPFQFKHQNCINIFVSEFVRSKFAFNNQDNRVIYPGSDFNFFQQTKYTSSNSKILGMVYRLDDHKLKLNSIEPFITAVKLDNSIKVSIVGDGSLKLAFMDRVKEESLEDAFTFHGYVPYNALPALYEEMSVFVAPVYEESFGQVTPFAMNMGIPVFGYDTGALNEIIKDENCLVKTGESTLLAEILVNAVNNPNYLEKKSEENRKLAMSYSLEKMIAGYTDVYKEVVNKTT